MGAHFEDTHLRAPMNANNKSNRMKRNGKPLHALRSVSSFTYDYHQPSLSSLPLACVTLLFHSHLPAFLIRKLSSSAASIERFL